MENENGIVNENSLSSEVSITNSPMPETFDIEKINDGNEAQLYDDDEVVEAPPDAPAEETPEQQLEQENANKPEPVNEWQQKYTTLEAQHKDITSKVAQFEQLLARPEVMNAIQQALNINQQQPPSTSANNQTQQPAGTLGFEDIENYLESPKVFAEAMNQKITAATQRMITEHVSREMNKMVEMLKPVLDTHHQTQAKTVLNEFKEKYKESEVYLDGKSPQYQEIRRVAAANPSLSLEEAYLIARGKFATTDAQKMAQDIAKKKQAMTLNAASETSVASAKRMPKTPREAALMAFQN